MDERWAVDLANEELRSAGDLRRWLQRLPEFDEGTSEEVSLRLPEFLDLRGAILQTLEASVGGGPFPAAAVERLNEASARVPLVRRLEPPDVIQRPVASSATTRALAEIAWSAIELMGTDRRERLRRCDACGRFFVATRTDRRWCSAACGNRTRVARHFARRRAGS
ncbi:MAG TPA: ABATE domain-containing protein [Actinomycetota bacterium]|nr:ABATE domain-containing protein [Actinomycetota bacterium]